MNIVCSLFENNKNLPPLWKHEKILNENSEKFQQYTLLSYSRNKSLAVVLCSSLYLRLLSIYIYAALYTGLIFISSTKLHGHFDNGHRPSLSFYQPFYLHLFYKSHALICLVVCDTSLTSSIMSFVTHYL